MSMDINRFLRSDRLLKILVVDDDQDNLLLITHQLLQLINCSVISADDGYTAIAAAQKSQPDLILLDIMMPGMDGLEVVRRLKQNLQTKSIPVIAVTAMARLEDRELALRAGCDSYLSKPYDMDDLAALISRQLGASVGLGGDKEIGEAWLGSTETIADSFFYVSGDSDMSSLHAT